MLRSFLASLLNKKQKNTGGADAEWRAVPAQAFLQETHKHSEATALLVDPTKPYLGKFIVINGKTRSSSRRLSAIEGDRRVR